MATNNGGSDDPGDKPAPPPNPWGLPGAGNNRPRPEPVRPDPGRASPGRSEPGRGPWGGGNRTGGNPGIGDIDDAIAQAQAWLRGMMPRFGGGGSGGGSRGRAPSGGRGALLLAIAVVAIWLATGFYRVQPDEQGVVLRFGAFNRTTLPGLNYHIPWPIETVDLPSVTHINRVELGYRSAPSGNVESGQDATNGRDVLAESLMLTGDENIIDINFAVFWRIRDAGAYLFATRAPDYTVRAVSESMMREVIGRTPIQPALTTARAEIETAVRANVQAILDSYGSGVEVTQVQLQKVDPPSEVIESFRDVQRANTDAERARNEAEAYRNDIVPRARGESAAVTAAADAQRQAAIAESTGQSQRFLSVLKAYDAAKDITLTRLYIETMQDVLTHSPTTVIDSRVRGVLPYLPLGNSPTAAPPPPPSGAAQPTPAIPGPTAGIAQ